MNTSKLFKNYRLISLFLVVLFIASCSDDDDTTPPPPEEEMSPLFLQIPKTLMMSLWLAHKTLMEKALWN